MGVPVAEYVAGNEHQVLANRGFEEFLTGSPGQFWKQIKRTAGSSDFVVILQPFVHQIPFVAVGINMPVDIRVECSHSSVLGRVRRADKCELLQLDHRIDNFSGTMNPCDPPTGHGMGL